MLVCRGYLYIGADEVIDRGNAWQAKKPNKPIKNKLKEEKEFRGRFLHLRAKVRSIIIVSIYIYQ